MLEVVLKSETFPDSPVSTVYLEISTPAGVGEPTVLHFVERKAAEKLVKDLQVLLAKWPKDS